MYKILYLYILIMLMTLTIQAQANQDWKTASKQEATDLIEHSKNWFKTTPSYSFAISHATYAGHSATSPYEKQSGYFKKYTGGFHSRILGIHTIQTKNSAIIIDSAKQIISVSNPVKSFEPVNAADLEGIQKSLDKCTAIKILSSEQSKTLRLEFSNKSPIATYEFCMNKEGLPKSIVIYYAEEVKSIKDESKVKPKLVVEISNYKTGVSPAKEELNEQSYFYQKDKNVLVLNEHYKKYSLLDQRIPTNNNIK